MLEHYGASAADARAASGARKMKGDALAAWRNWQAAVDDWAVRSGVGARGSAGKNARNLALMRIPYSLAYLRANGRGEMATTSRARQRIGRITW